MKKEKGTLFITKLKFDGADITKANGGKPDDKTYCYSWF